MSKPVEKQYNNNRVPSMWVLKFSRDHNPGCFIVCAKNSVHARKRMKNSYNDGKFAEYKFPYSRLDLDNKTEEQKKKEKEEAKKMIKKFKKSLSKSDEPDFPSDSDSDSESDDEPEFMSMNQDKDHVGYPSVLEMIEKAWIQPYAENMIFFSALDG
jgi:hypothetical protein